MTQLKKSPKMFLRSVISGIRGIRDLRESPFIRAIRASRQSATICVHPCKVKPAHRYERATFMLSNRPS
jgi:hypothetical protein